MKTTINFTRNYELFHNLDSNRPINVRSLKVIKQSIDQIGYLQSKPITVCPFKNGLIVIDGQHRLRACIDLNIPVPYVVEDLEDIGMAMTKLNIGQQNWTLENWVNYYASEGMECYQEILRFQDNSKLNTSNSIVIITNAKLKADSIRNGVEFLPNENAKGIEDFLIICRKFHKFTYKAKFVEATTRLFYKANKTQINRMKMQISSLVEQIQTTGYIKQFELLINKGIKNKENLIKF